MLSRPGHIIIGDGALMKCDSAAQLLTDRTVKNKAVSVLTAGPGLSGTRLVIFGRSAPCLCK